MSDAPSEATTVATLTPEQVRDLTAVEANAHHPMIASRIKMFYRLGLMIPTERRRAPTGKRSGRRLLPRGNVLTDLGRSVVAARRAAALPQAYPTAT